jgi:mRNA interferase RelE/StbE
VRWRARRPASTGLKHGGDGTRADCLGATVDLSPGGYLKYEIEIRPSAVRELPGLSPDVARRILRKLEVLRNGLTGDVKKLTNHPVGYRLRIGDWRVLFDLDGAVILVRSVRHRSSAY